MLRGNEYFYGDWLELVRAVATLPPVVDLGTPAPFHKEMAVLQGPAPEPYWCFDYVHSSRIDGVADAHHLPFRDDSIGTVLCSHLLEHVAEPGRVISEVRRVLKPGGSVYLTFLDLWPYHASEGVYSDYHRFKRDAIDLLLHNWTYIKVVQGGGLAQVAVNFVPQRWQGVAQRIANSIDRRWLTTAAPAFYVTARKP